MGLLSTNYGTGKDDMNESVNRQQFREAVARILDSPDWYRIDSSFADDCLALLEELERSDRIEQALQQVIDAAASVPDSDDLAGLLFLMGRVAMARDALAALGSSVGASA